MNAKRQLDLYQAFIAGFNAASDRPYRALKDAWKQFTIDRTKTKRAREDSNAPNIHPSRTRK